MKISNVLRSGYTFTPDEYELETKYVLTNALLVLMTFVYIIPLSFYYTNEEIEKSIPYVMALLINLFSLYVARLVGKDNYQKLVYFSMTLYSVVIFYAYYIEPTLTPSTSWVLILIVTSFLVTSIYTGLVVSLAYLAFLFYMNNVVFEYANYEYIVLQITPIVIGLFVIYMFEKKFVNTILLLEKSNRDLEQKVEARTKELKAEKESLDYQAHYDFLTGLPNRNKFHEEIENWTQNDKKRVHSFCLLFIDLDRFKRVNDSLGHSAGDKVLKVVATRVKKIIPKNAFFSRISGDEFTLLFPFKDSLSEVHDMAEKLIQVIKEPIVLKEHTLYISASIGISAYPQNSVYHDDLIKYADTSMFEAKKSGRGSYKFYANEMTHRVEEIVFVETEIYTALEKEEFVLYYQPQIDIRTGELSGMEALIRWNHPKLGLSFPQTFIPLAEDVGAIIMLDYYVFKKGMSQIVTWKEEGLDIPRISFNFSTKHLENKDFVTVIETILEETGCKGDWIELEITESHVMSNIEESIEVLKSLRSLGISIAIDDFGTGYSSLNYLKILPVDKLKIDQSFIEHISSSKVDMSICKAIIDVGNSIGLTVIAEGVTTKVQEEFLRTEGCYHIQGYLYYKAMPVVEVEKVLFKV